MAARLISTMNRHSALAIAGAVIASFVSLAGCLHSNLPGSTGNTLAADDPNVFPTPKLAALSLEYVVSRYPPAAGTASGEPTFAFNLPVGMRPENCDLVSAILEGRGVPVTPENASRLPIYHIATMWIRGSRAQVEMVFPVEAIGMTPSQQPVYRGVSLHLGSDMGPWRVMRQQLWNVGTIPVPELQFCHSEPAPEPAIEIEESPAPAEQSPAPMIEVEVVEPATTEGEQTPAEGDW